jgi:hypothetical protein
MKTKRFLLLTLLLSVLMILSACAPEAAPEEPQESAAPEEIPYPYPYPVPEQSVRPSGPIEPYPASQEIIANDAAMSRDPYPGVEVVGNTSSIDLSEAITPAEFAVSSSDKDLQVGPVFIERSEIVMKESYPVQVELVIIGNLPTPCNQLRVVAAEPDENGHIEIEAYTLSDPGKMCAQVLKPFTAVVPLGEYTEGIFTLSINNELDGGFKLP